MIGQIFFEVVHGLTDREVLRMIQVADPLFADDIIDYLFHEIGLVREVVFEPPQETPDLVDLFLTAHDSISPMSSTPFGVSVRLV